MRWTIAFAVTGIAELIVIQICDAVGVGHQWPFYVLLPLSTAVGVCFVKTLKELK